MVYIWLDSPEFINTSYTLLSIGQMENEGGRRIIEKKGRYYTKFYQSFCTKKKGQNVQVDMMLFGCEERSVSRRGGGGGGSSNMLG